MKMIIKISLIVLILNALLSQSIYAIEDEMLVPESIKKVYLGMKYAEFKKLYPKSRDGLIGPENGIIVAELIEDDLWDSVLYVFQNDRLSAFTLMRGVSKRQEMSEKQHFVVTRILSEYGKGFEKKIAKGPGKKDLRPVFIWRENKFVAYLSYMPSASVAEGKRSSIRLTFAIKSKSLTEVFEVPTLQELKESLQSGVSRQKTRLSQNATPKEFEEALFDKIIGEEIMRLIQ